MAKENELVEPFILAASRRLPVVLLGAAVFALGALLLFLTLSSPRGFYNSPDEMANALFAQGVEVDGKLIRPALQPHLPSSVAPRGMLRTQDGFIPVGFVSFPVLLGSLARLIGLRGVLILTSLLGAFALVAWYGFLRPLLGARVALLSAFLTAAHPFVLYWGERPLLPNTLFVSLIIFSLYFLGMATRVRSVKLSSYAEVALESPPVKQAPARRRAFSLLAGLTFGLAVALRPQEGTWLAAIPFFILLIQSWRRAVSPFLFIITAAVPLGGLLALQNAIYGSPLRTGYHLTPANVTTVQILRRLILPFGLHPAQISPVLYHYIFSLVWWISTLAIVGIILAAFLRNGRLLRRMRIIAFATLALAVWFLVFYGSFSVEDRFDRASASIGTSFTRYFLPIYVLATPLVAYALYGMRRRMGKIVASGVTVLVVTLSLRLVFWGSDESVAKIVQVLYENRATAARAASVLPVDAVVLTDRSDKIFFPAREVVTRFRKFHQPDFEELYGLNLYYETIADQDVVAFENERFWGPHRLKAQDPVDLGYRHTLYKLKVQSSNDNSNPKSK